MRVIKHLIAVAKMKLKAIGCKHENVEALSCPFTRLTYTTCNRCLTRVKVEKTIG